MKVPWNVVQAVAIVVIAVSVFVHVFQPKLEALFKQSPAAAKQQRR